MESFLIAHNNVSNEDGIPIAVPPKDQPWAYIAEVYWGDATGFRSEKWWLKYLAPLLVLGLVLRFLLALSQVAGSGWDLSSSPASRPSIFAKILKYGIFTFAVPSPIIFTTPMFFVLAPSDAKWLLMAGVFIIPALISIYLWRFDAACKWGLVVTLLGTISMLAVFSQSTHTVEFWAEFSASVVSKMQIGATVLVILALAEVFCSVGRSPLRPSNVSGLSLQTRAHPFLLKVFAITFPFAVIGGCFGSLGWATNLWAVLHSGAKLEAFNTWSDNYQKSFDYDLALMESVFATALFAVGALISILLLGYILLLWIGSRSAKWSLGTWFRAGLSGFLFMYLSVTLVFLAIFITDYFGTLTALHGFRDGFLALVLGIAECIGFSFPSTRGEARYDVLEIYASSATRIISLLPTVAPTAIIILATAADVVFWLVKSEAGATGGIADACRRKFEDTVNAINKNGGRVDCVVGYSQGSIVAIDALLRRDDIERIVTVGSPISSLYEDFLGIELGRDDKLSSRWENYWRKSDFIGGPISWAQATSESDQLVEEHYAKSHFDYFSEPKVIMAVNRIGNL